MRENLSSFQPPYEYYSCFERYYIITQIRLQLRFIQTIDYWFMKPTMPPKIKVCKKHTQPPETTLEGLCSDTKEIALLCAIPCIFGQVHLGIKTKKLGHLRVWHIFWWHKIDLRKIDIFYAKSVRPFIYRDFVIPRYTSVVSRAQSATKSNGSA